MSDADGVELAGTAAAAAGEPAPEGWEEHVDDDGNVYYHHRGRDASVWTLDEARTSSASAAGPAAAGAAPLALGAVAEDGAGPGASAAAATLRAKIDPLLRGEFDRAVRLLREEGRRASVVDRPSLIGDDGEYRPAGSLPFGASGPWYKDRKRGGIVLVAALAVLLAVAVTLGVLLSRDGGAAPTAEQRASETLERTLGDALVADDGTFRLAPPGAAGEDDDGSGGAAGARLGPFVAAAVGALGGALQLEDAVEVPRAQWLAGGAFRAEVVSALSDSLDARVVRGRWRFGVAGAAEADCSVGLFFGAGEAVFDAAALEAVAECDLGAQWTARDWLPALRERGAPVWLDALTPRLDAAVVVSTAAWRADAARAAEDGELLAELPRGVSVFGRFSARNGTGSAPVFGGTFDLVTPAPAAMDPFSVQFSLPLNATGRAASPPAEPFGRLTLPGASLRVADAGALQPALGVDVRLDGADAAGAPRRLAFGASLAVRYPDRGGEAVFSLQGEWDRAAEEINMTGAMRASGGGWLPFDGELAVVTRASASARVSTAGGRLALSAAELEGEAVLLYAGARASLEARATLTPDDTLLEVGGVRLDNLTELVGAFLERGRPGSLAGEAARLVSPAHLRLPAGAEAAVTLSSGPAAGRPRGLAVVVRGVELAAGAYGGAADVAPLVALEPQLLATLDLEVNVPVFEDQDSAAWDVTLLARGEARLGAAGVPVVLDELRLVVGTAAAGGGDVTVGLRAAARVLLPDRAGGPVALRLDGSYANGTARLAGDLGEWASPFGADWVSVEGARFSAVLPPSPSPATLELEAEARLSFADAGAAALRVAGVVTSAGDACVTASADGLAQLHAGAAGSFDASASLSFCTAESGAEVAGAAVPGGFFARATAVSARPGGMGGTLEALVAPEPVSLGAAELVASAPLSRAGGAPAVRFELRVPLLVVYDAVRLENTTLSFEVADGGEFRVALASALVLELPQDARDIAIGVTASYGSDDGVLVVNGTLPSWPRPFGLEWIDVESTLVAVRVPRAPAPKSVSLLGGAALRPDADDPARVERLEVCGAVQGGDAALSVRGLDGGTVAALVCRTMGVCTATSMLESAGLGEVSLDVTVATGALTDDAWRAGGGLLCGFPEQPYAGVSLSVSAPFAGDLRDKLQEVLFPDAGSLGEWRFRVNLPFAPGAPALVPSRARALAAGAGPLEARAAGLAPQGLGELREFNVNFENSAMVVPVGDWFNVTGVGMQGVPFAAPPAFRVWLTFVVSLESNDAPLRFRAEGEVAGAAVRLTGQMLVDGDGWVDPFGLRGLVVRGAAVSVGFGATAIDSFGLAFDLRLGRIDIYFAGLVSLSGLARSSYLLGSVSGADGGRVSLRDLAVAVRDMSGGRVDVPESALPGPDVLSLQHADFRLASADGVDLLGNEFRAGFRVSAHATVFSVDVTVAVASTRLASGLTDFSFSVSADFSAFNRKVIDWLNSFLPFDVDKFLGGAGASLCDIACVNRVDLLDISVLGLVEPSLPPPTLFFSVSLFGNRHDLTIELDALKLGFSMSSLLDTVKDSLGDLVDLCVFDFNCGRNEKCDFPICRSTCGAGTVPVGDDCVACPAGSTYSDRYGCVPEGLATPAGLAGGTSRRRPSLASVVPGRLRRFEEHRRREALELAREGRRPSVPWYRRAGVDIYHCEEYRAAYADHLERGLIRVTEAGRVEVVEELW